MDRKVTVQVQLVLPEFIQDAVHQFIPLMRCWIEKLYNFFVINRLHRGIDHFSP